MTDNYAVRALALDEWEIFRDIRLEALRAHPDAFFMPYEKQAAFSKEEWQSRLGPVEKKRVFGLFHGKDIVGIAGIFTNPDNPQQDNAHIAMVYVQSAHRGRNLARMLYWACLRWAMDASHITTVTVGHREGNEASRRAILAQGFRYTKRQPSQQWPDGMIADGLEYELAAAEIVTLLV